MPEPSLQTAFEIKTQCDEISRQLLRWHWEQRPGSHTFEDLLQHIQQLIALGNVQIVFIETFETINRTA